MAGVSCRNRVGKGTGKERTLAQLADSVECLPQTRKGLVSKEVKRGGEDHLGGQSDWQGLSRCMERKSV